VICKFILHLQSTTQKTNDRTPPQTRCEPRCSEGIEFLLNMWHPSC
jgi:hypothetical protein